MTRLGARTRAALRIALSAALLVGLAWGLDGEALARRLADLDPAWALAGLVLSLPQMALLAFRWRLTSARLGLALPFRTALSEYYLAVFLNQLLPGGVLGDVARAWRHGRAEAGDDPGAVRGMGATGAAPALGPAVRAVILERASGQVVMGAAAVVSLMSLPIAGAVRGRAALFAAGLVVALVAAAIVLARTRIVPRIGHDLYTALLARDVVAVQLGTSALVLATYLGMYVAAARAVGLTTPLGALLPLVPPVLLSMLIPVTIAGWGVREAAAAGVWAAVGLTVEDGVAASAAYGVLVLFSTLPGALVLLSAGRGRRGGPRPAGTSGSGGGAPPRGARSAGG